MEMVLGNGFCEMSAEETFLLDGGLKIFGCSIGGLASGTLAGAAVGATVGGVPGLVVGALVCAGVTYIYDSF